MPSKMSRSAYAQMFGPTLGDMRPADTDLVIEVEKDFYDVWRGSEIWRRKGHRDGMGHRSGRAVKGRWTPLTNAVSSTTGNCGADIAIKTANRSHKGRQSRCSRNRHHHRAGN